MEYEKVSNRVDAKEYNLVPSSVEKSESKMVFWKAAVKDNAMVACLVAWLVVWLAVY